jgi:hypothetical protein
MLPVTPFGYDSRGLKVTLCMSRLRCIWPVSKGRADNLVDAVIQPMIRVVSRGMAMVRYTPCLTNIPPSVQCLIRGFLLRGSQEQLVRPGIPGSPFFLPPNLAL